VTLLSPHASSFAFASPAEKAALRYEREEIRPALVLPARKNYDPARAISVEHFELIGEGPRFRVLSARFS
jgi:hypothetical protein